MRDFNLFSVVIQSVNSIIYQRIDILMLKNSFKVIRIILNPFTIFVFAV
jgi:hypothetical protein